MLRRLQRISSYLWASPATAIGLCVALAARAGGASVRRVDGVLEAGGGALGRMARRSHFVAITLGHVVVGIDETALAESREHERAHVRQYERFGPLFLPLYAASSLWAALRGGRMYWDNHFERQARDACTPRA
jgi:hypothetical protein